MAEQKIKMSYSGSIGWVIFWIIVFFPVALVLMATAGRFELNRRLYYLRYDGSRPWLCFWTIVFFPVAFALLLLNGISLISDEGLTPEPI